MSTVPREHINNMVSSAYLKTGAALLYVTVFEMENKETDVDKMSSDDEEVMQLRQQQKKPVDRS